jgi:hypothetical protein
MTREASDSPRGGPDSPAESSRSPPQDRFPELATLCRRHPLAYAGYRVAYLRHHNRNISEADEIPFVTSVLFPVAILGYLLLARVRHLLDVLRGTARSWDLGADDHVFVMSSTRGYRSRTFLELADAVQERGERAVLLCSPAATDSREDWEEEGFRTVTHRELHGRVGVLNAVVGAVRAVLVTARLRRIDDPAVGSGTFTLVYNFVLLECVKRESVRPLTRADPSVHTFSPMPYLLTATDADSVFAYQHGLQQPLGDKIMALPFFAPFTLLIWGEPWRDTFRPHVHSEADIRVVGSPWYEYLAEKRDPDRDPAYDVLFISASHGLTNPEIEAAFASLAETLVETCERRGYSLAVKLHPLEDADWYDDRGWGEYVVAYDDIDDALLDARVSVTNASTAFVESAVLGVPVVVTDLWEHGLDSLAPVDYVRFADVGDVPAAVDSAVAGDAFPAGSSGTRPGEDASGDDSGPDETGSEESRSLVVTDRTVERALAVVDERRS